MKIQHIKLCNAMKAAFRRKFIELNAYIRKAKRSKISN